MKIIAIGDIHGRAIWKDIINQEFDLVVFMGDYFDSFDISVYVQTTNFLDICEYKKNNTDKVIMLTGNHDMHYGWLSEKYSGYNHAYSYQIGQVLIAKRGLMKMIHVEGNHLFSHAGVSRTWCANHNVQDVEHINDLLRYKPNSFEFQGDDEYGDDVTQSPIWIRPRSLREDAIEGYIQVVGHTEQEALILEAPFLIDTLVSGEYLCIEDGNYSVGKIKI